MCQGGIKASGHERVHWRRARRGSEAGSIGHRGSAMERSEEETPAVTVSIARVLSRRGSPITGPRHRCPKGKSRKLRTDCLRPPNTVPFVVTFLLRPLPAVVARSQALSPILYF